MDCWSIMRGCPDLRIAYHEMPGASIQTEATSRSLAKSMHQQKNCIDPNGGSRPQFGKMDGH